MKIVWVCNSTEAETDLWRAAQNHADLDIETWCVSAVEGKIELPYFQHGVLRPGPEGRRELLERVAAVGADLFVFRYPTWLTADGLEGTFRRLFADRPVNWMSLAVSAVITVGLLFYSTYVFRRMERIFADII